MKKTTFAITVFGMLLFANFNAEASSLSNGPVKATTVNSVNKEWTKAKDGAWPGVMNGKTYWYKLDKNAKLWWSTDNGKNWMEVQDQMWSDKSGKFLKVNDGALVWSTSANKGKSWTAVPDWTWQASDGRWYKFDSEWNLWVK